jgi:hypothetical protein
MDKDYVTAGLHEPDLDDLLKEIRKTKVNLGGIKVLLILIVIGLAYISASIFLGNNSTEVLDSTNRALVIRIDEEASEYSDVTQVKNALGKGGMIQVKISGDSLKEVLGSAEFSNYGAMGADGYYYTLGAFLNYIASRGWTFVQAPSSGLSTYYYFRK